MKRNNLLQSFEFFYLKAMCVHNFGRHTTMVVGKAMFSQSIVHILKFYVVPSEFLKNNL